MSLARAGKRRPYQRHTQDPELSMDELASIIGNDLAAFPFALPDETALQCARYCHLLHKWNGVYNLTSVRDVRLMVPRHIMDSLSIQPWLQGQHILDAGCGAGLPGIPLAIANPDRHFTLVDSNHKKTRFVRQAVVECTLKNVTVINARIEDVELDQPVDTLVSRAFTSIENFIEGTAHMMTASTRILAMKGTYPLAELESIPSGYSVQQVEKLQVPGLDADRHLVILTPTS